jgi:hypothetical protein
MVTKKGAEKYLGILWIMINKNIPKKFGLNIIGR